MASKAPRQLSLRYAVHVNKNLTSRQSQTMLSIQNAVFKLSTTLRLSGNKKTAALWLLFLFILLAYI
jgi:hypothetical protein